MPTIDFYFDFTSPYAYLAHCRLPGLADRHGYEIAYKPIDLKAAKLAIGNDGPANMQLPVKMRYIMADIMRWVQRYKAPFNVGKGATFESERSNIGTLYAIEKGRARDYVNALWHASFGSGGSMGSDDLLRDVASQMGWSPDTFLEFIESDAARQRYQEVNRQAQDRGVFGVPTMMVGDQMWWGNDRIDFLDEYLAAHPANKRADTQIEANA